MVHRRGMDFGHVRQVSSAALTKLVQFNCQSLLRFASRTQCNIITAIDYVTRERELLCRPDLYSAVLTLLIYHTVVQYTTHCTRCARLMHSIPDLHQGWPANAGITDDSRETHAAEEEGCICITDQIEVLYCRRTRPKYRLRHPTRQCTLCTDNKSLPTA